MIGAVEKVYDKGKKSLESFLREKAYTRVLDRLKEKGIDIHDISDEDVESLVASKIEDMENEIKGLGKGVALSIVLFLLTGV